jgi:hypothetical protein
MANGNKPRPPHFPYHPKLERLLDGYDPGLGYFKLLLWRREARDLRKGLFGPKGSRVVPEFDGDLNYYDGEMEFDLPNGWLLRLTYGPPSFEMEAGDVVAEFIPPPMREKPPIPEPEEPTVDARGRQAVGAPVQA